MNKWFLNFIHFLDKYLHCKLLFGAVDFAGTQGYLSGGTIVNNTAEFTLSAWVRREADDTDDYIASKVDTFGGGGYIFFIDDVSSISGRTNCLRFTVYDYNNAGTWTIESPTNAIAQNTWYHVAFSLKKGDATGMRVYIDGVEVADSPVDVSALGSWNQGSNYTFNLGRYSGYTNNDAMFSGKITEVALWDKILTSAEILHLATAKIKGLPLQIQKANLQAYFPLDDLAEGTSIHGATFKNRSGTTDLTGADAGSVSVSAAETVLSYPQDICYVDAQAGEEPPASTIKRRMLMGVGV